MRSSKLLIFSFSLLLLGACTSDPIEPADNTSDCSDAPQITLVSSQNTSCGLSVGNVIVNATGGNGNLDFSIDGSNYQSNGDFNQLAAGTYTITVKDENDCTDEVEVTIANDDGVNISLETVDAGCDASNGEIKVIAIDGTRPYSYKLGVSGTYQSDSTFTGLDAVSYDVFVKDDDGCEVSETVVLETGVQFSTVKSIVSTNCAISGCHAGAVSPNLSIDANIQSSASRVKARTGATTMPPSSSGITLTAQEIAQIACWVDDGAKL